MTLRLQKPEPSIGSNTVYWTVVESKESPDTEPLSNPCNPLIPSQKVGLGRTCSTIRGKVSFGHDRFQTKFDLDGGPKTSPSLLPSDGQMGCRIILETHSH